MNSINICIGQRNRDRNTRWISFVFSLTWFEKFIHALNTRRYLGNFHCLRTAAQKTRNLENFPFALKRTYLRFTYIHTHTHTQRPFTVSLRSFPMFLFSKRRRSFHVSLFFPQNPSPPLLLVNRFTSSIWIQDKFKVVKGNVNIRTIETSLTWNQRDQLFIYPTFLPLLFRTFLLKKFPSLV